MHVRCVAVALIANEHSESSVVFYCSIFLATVRVRYTACLMDDDRGG